MSNAFYFDHPGYSSDEDLPESDAGVIDDQDSTWQDSDVSEDSDSSESSDDEPLVPLLSSGPRRSSPVTGTRAERAVKRLKKGADKRKATIQRQKEVARKAAKQQRQAVLEEVLEHLQTNGLRFWDLMEYVFNPENGKGDIRYSEFFVRKSNATTVLGWWMSMKNRGRRAKAELHEWITQYAAQTMGREAQAVTKSKELQTLGRTIDAQVVKEFDLEKIHDRLQTTLAPFSMRLLEAFTTAKGVNKHTEHRKQRTKMVCGSLSRLFLSSLNSSVKVITSAALLCLGEYSHSNNLAKRMIGLYLFASGAQRQCITVLSTLGLSESYTNVLSKNIRRKRKVKHPEVEEDPFIDQPPIDQLPAPSTEIIQHTGTLHQLSDSMRSRAREIAATGLFSMVYDNININFRNAEQIVGRHGMSKYSNSCPRI